MFKWIKIVKSQYLGFWMIGILLFILQEIPYMIMPLFNLETNPIMEMPTNSLWLDIFEKIFGIFSVAVMVLIVHKENKVLSFKASKISTIFFGATAIILLLNYIGWILYFCGFQSVAIMIVFIFALPSLYYLCIGLWRKNYFLILVSSIFFIIHITNGFINLL